MESTTGASSSSPRKESKDGKYPYFDSNEKQLFVRDSSSPTDESILKPCMLSSRKTAGSGAKENESSVHSNVFPEADSTTRDESIRQTYNLLPKRAKQTESSVHPKGSPVKTLENYFREDSLQTKYPKRSSNRNKSYNESSYSASRDVSVKGSSNSQLPKISTDMKQESALLGQLLSKDTKDNIPLSYCSKEHSETNPQVSSATISGKEQESRDNIFVPTAKVCSSKSLITSTAGSSEMRMTSSLPQIPLTSFPMPGTYQAYRGIGSMVTNVLTIRNRISSAIVPRPISISGQKYSSAFPREQICTAYRPRGAHCLSAAEVTNPSYSPQRQASQSVLQNTDPPSSSHNTEDSHSIREALCVNPSTEERCSTWPVDLSVSFGNPKSEVSHIPNIPHSSNIREHVRAPNFSQVSTGDYRSQGSSDHCMPEARGTSNMALGSSTIAKPLLSSSVDEATESSSNYEVACDPSFIDTVMSLPTVEDLDSSTLLIDSREIPDLKELFDLDNLLDFD